MKWITGIVAELWGLFVEDGSYTTAILVWVALIGFGRPWIPGGAAWAGPILFAGLALILIENISRSARKLAK